jgi:outer membrane immunogenic protein
MGYRACIVASIASSAVAGLMMSLLAQPASAADMAVKAPIAPIAAPSWTGFYVGVVGGYGAGNQATNFVFAGITGLPGTPVEVRPDGRGGLFGIEAGYNHQIGRALLGIEGDIDYAHISGSATSVSPNGFFMAPTTQSIKSLGTVRGRVGFLANDNLLLYGTGGVAFGRVGMTTAFIPTGILGGNCVNSSCGAGAASSTKAGPAVGAGVEYAWTNRVSVKVEYLFVDLGRTSTTFPITLAVSTMAANSFYEAHIVRAGLNVKLGGP